MRDTTKTNPVSTLRDPAELFADSVVLGAPELALPVELLVGSAAVVVGSVVEFEDGPLSKVTARSEIGNESVESVIDIPDPLVHTDEVPGAPATNFTPAHYKSVTLSHTQRRGNVLDTESHREVVQQLVLHQPD